MAVRWWTRAPLDFLQRAVCHDWEKDRTLCAGPAAYLGWRARPTAATPRWCASRCRC